MTEIAQKKIIIRADASYAIGTGHVMRMLALAEYFKSVEAHVVFASREHPGNLNDVLRLRGFNVCALPYYPESDAQQEDTRTWLGAGTDLDLLETFSAGPCDILIVDHYGVDKEWCTKARDQTSFIVCVDDEALRALDCDVLINQNYYHDKNIYEQQDLPEHTIKLLGPAYALLRSEFANMRESVHARTQLKNILVLMGGRDLHGIGQNLAQNIDPSLGFDLTFIGGGATLSALCDKKGYKYLDHTNNMASFMASADFCFGAAGSASWERCSLYLPSALFILAENQTKIAQNIQLAGACINLGHYRNFDFKCVNNFLFSLLNDSKRLNTMSQKAGSLVDGLGVLRVGACIQGMLT